MSTMTRTSSDTSVTFSLAELASLEQERVREEDLERSRAREKEARALRDAETQRREAEAARLAAESEARARREREEAAEKVRLEARERVAADVARIEVEARARLEADNAVRAHELSMLRARTETGQRRLLTALAVALGLVLSGGGVAAYQVSQHVAGLEKSAALRREERVSLERERDSARAAELAAVDRYHAELRARALASSAAEARATADAARSAVDGKASDLGRVRAVGAAGRPPSSSPAGAVKQACAQGDPGCGLDGTRIF
ncbi:MAG: hypothetical protein ABI134_16160 [Byssovorax sp.]